VKLKHPVLHGHPLHAMASDLPVALIPLALVAAVAERARPCARARQTSATTNAIALGAATTAALIGWWDWLTIPGEHPAKSPATAHGLINTAGLGVSAFALLLPRRRLELLIALSASLAVAAWIGGDLVYRLGWRVRPAEELEQLDSGRSRKEALAIIDAHEREDTFLS